MNTRIQTLNQKQLNSKKPVIDKEKTHFDWEDTSLLPLLTDGLPTMYPRSTSKENREDEQEAIRIANQLISEANKGLEYLRIKDEFDATIASHDGYISSRLTALRQEIIEGAKARKGLLIYGEGGIGKTYFLYELAQKLSLKQFPYIVAFNQEGITELSEIGIRTISELHPEGFILLIDACNELDDSAFETTQKIIEEALQINSARIVATTRSESPTSRKSELESTLPASIEFQGVNPDLVFAALAECADEIIIQFQDMLFSRNPRNLSVMLAMIKDFRPGEDGRNATTQRTALIERCIKKSLNAHRWEQTKMICELLLNSNAIGFTKEDARAVLGEESEAYLSDMVEQGFIERYGYDELKYYFSSESQIRFVIARCLNKRFDEINRSTRDENELASKVAGLVADKSFYSNEHEMVQAAVDRYIARGPDFLAKLLTLLKQLGMDPEWERLLTQTIFPLNWDHERFVDLCKINHEWAFLNFSGILNTPFNLTNYANDLLQADTSLVDAFFVQKWERWELAPLIARVQNITEFVAHTNRVPSTAKTEWVWLAIWCSFSSDTKLRALSQRLLFFLCDSDNDALAETIAAWSKIDDVYARRAITKAISHLDKSAKNSGTVRQFLSKIVSDSSVTDSIIIANVCRALDGRITPLDFSSANLYLDLSEPDPTADEIDSFERQASWIDLACKDFFPFDIHQAQKGYIDFHYSGRFISASLESVKAWNNSLQNLLNCQAGGTCRGSLMHEDDFQDLLPIDFKREILDQQRLMSHMVALTKSWLKRYGGNLQNLLGEFKPSPPYRDTYITPNMKPFDLASHELLGSLASNYFIDEIVLGGGGYNLCGFCQYEEWAYNDPGTIHTCPPVSNSKIDSAKSKLERRVVSPEGNGVDWFNDKDEAFSEILNLISSIQIGDTYWQPIAFSASNRIKLNDDLLCSNEFVISIAFNTELHINGSRDDRYLTIERKNFEGNMKDYAKTEESLCLSLAAPDENCSITQRSSILLPPPSMVGHLHLFFDPKNACFVDEATEEIAIMCDGAPRNYYEEPIHNLILMRQDIYEELTQNAAITFFAFSERYHDETGYMNDCERHWEFLPDGSLVNSYPNRGGESSYVPEFCKDCYFSSENRNARWEEKHGTHEFKEPDWLSDLLNLYSPNNQKDGYNDPPIIKEANTTTKSQSGTGISSITP